MAVASPPSPGRDLRSPAGAWGAPHGILIVEDEPELVRALRINLRARQYDVLTAGTGREALAVAASHPPDAIILDLGLPDIDGTEVIVELRRVVPRADHRAVRADQPGRQDRRAGRGRRRLRDQAVRDGRAAGPAARRAAPRRRRGRPGPGPPGHDRAVAGRPGRAPGQARRPRDDARDTLRLTPTEWRILEILLRRPGQLVGSAQLLTAVWGPGVRVSAPTTSASTWRGCGASWRTTRRVRATCSPNRGWGTATSRDRGLTGDFPAHRPYALRRV